MSTTPEDYGLSSTDVQSLMSATLHQAILFAFCHGIHTCIFLAALYYISQSAHSDRKRIAFAASITFLWCANTIIMILMWNGVNETFITHGASLETEFNFYFTYNKDPRSLVITVFRVLSVFLADLILIWRCWVLYGGDLRIIALTSFSLITETTGAAFLIFYNNRSHDVGAARAIWTIVYYSTTMLTNVLCTFLLLLRIIHRSGCDVGVSLKTYRGLVEVLVESAAIYAAIYIALLVVSTYEVYIPNRRVVTASVYPLVISFSVTGIAPTLIIARVMAGQARPNDSWTRPSLPHMQRDRSPAELRFASVLQQP